MNRRASILFTAAATVAGVGGFADAAIVLTSGATVTEDFNSLPSTGTTTLTAGPELGVEQDLPGTEFQGTEVAGTGTFTFVASDGSSISGALFSFGAAGSTERALGTLASGTTTPAFGAQITNNTGVQITSVAISFFQEQFRSATTNANTVPFSFGTTDTGVTADNFLDVTPTGQSPFTAFDLVGAAPVASNGPVDGNANRIARAGALPVMLDPGESLFVRFTDTNDQGNDAGLAIDDFSITPTLVPEPAALGLLGVGGLLALRRRRRA